MRIRYTYHNYPNCPKATEYSRSAETASAYGGLFIGLPSLASVVFLLISAFSFFGNYNWGEFLGSVAFVLAMALLDFYFFVIRPNNTSCEIKVILTEEGNSKLPKNTVQEYCELLRIENRKTNKDAFESFYPLFLVSFCDVIALIAGIKGVYFLCHKENGVFLLLASIVALGVFSYLIWRFVNKPAPISKTINTTTKSSTINTVESLDNDIFFCRKCGAKVLHDSTFCSKCGTKVR